MCFALWISSLGISKSFYYNVRALFLDGQTQARCDVKRAPTLRTNETCAWMRSFFNWMGEKMPDRATVHLPSSLTKLHVFKRMVDDLQSRGKESIIQKSHFFEIWKSQFKHVTIPKVH